MAELKYTYALDETKTRLVHINDARKGEVYYCVNSNCNEQMIVRDGGLRKKHFSHKYERHLDMIFALIITQLFGFSEQLNPIKVVTCNKSLLVAL